MPVVERLRLEHHSPGIIGIGERCPRISWSIKDDRADRQSSYELKIRWSDGQEDVQQCDTDECVLVNWPWRPLRSAERALLSVRVRCDDQTEYSQWSSPIAVETGLLEKQDWTGNLITPRAHTESQRPVVFSRAFNVDQGTNAARLYITAHGIYEAYLNDKRVGDHALAPGWTSYNHRLIYQTFDITDLLVPGHNELRVTVADGWYCGRLGFNGGRRHIYGDSVGLLVNFIIENADGSLTRSATDDSWSWQYGSHLRADLYDGETYDSTIDTAEQTWQSVHAIDIPATLVAPDGPPIRATEVIKPVLSLTTPSGKTIIDFGQNFAGSVRVSVSPSEQHTIVLRHAEVLEDGELGTRPLRAAAATDTIIVAKNKSLVWQPSFTFHGFRYVQVDGWLGDIQLSAFEGIVLHTDMQRLGTFSCSNLHLNQLHSNIVWSMRSNFMSIPMDCPQRDERLGWTGDINVFADTATYLYDTTGMLQSWLRDVAAEQAVGGGIVPLTVPNVVEGLESEAHAIWGDVAVMLPWALYEATGDENILQSQLQSMKTWLNAIPRANTGLWNYDSDWKLGDWLDPAAPPEDPGLATTDPLLVADAFLVRVLQLMAQICRLLGFEKESTDYAAQYDSAKTSFSDAYITSTGRLAADTQTAYTLALHFDLYKEPAHKAVAAARLDYLTRRHHRFEIATGFAGTPYIGLAMTKVGQSQLFYRMLLHKKNPSWLYPVTMGATTVWERWDSMLPDGKINPGEMTSFNHYALGSVGNWMHRVIIGLRPIEPGWKLFAVEPIPGGGLQWAEGQHLSPYGQCHVRWEIRRSSESVAFWMRITVPVNTTAVVTLPGRSESEQRCGGVHEWSMPYEEPAWPPQAIYARYVEQGDADLED